MISWRSIPCLSLVALLGLSAAHADDKLTTAAPSTALPADPAANCPAAPKPDPSAWSKSATAAFAYTEGNSNQTNLSLIGTIERDFESDYWRFQGIYNFGDAASSPNVPREEVRNDFRAFADYRRVFDDVYFGGVGLAFWHDDIADIKYRTAVNPALGAYLVRQDDLKFAVEAGPSYIFEEVGGVEDDYLSPRVANRFEWKISDTAKIYENAEIFFDINDSNNYIVNAEAGIEAALTSLVNIVLIVRDNFDNQPAIGRERNDIAILSGLKFNF